MLQLFSKNPAWCCGLAASFWMMVEPALAAQPDPVRRTPVVEVVEKVAPAVVNIAAESIVREVDPFFGPFFGSRTHRAQSLGSGLIIDPNGYVVTNAHVIEGASRIVVTLLDGRELQAEVLGSDRDADLAVLKVEGRNLPAVPLGPSQDLMMGETVVAIGNPFGLSHTVTTGVLSARGRSVPGAAEGVRFTDFLQTDASINPGNSGGPLVNLAGRVIGINTAIIQGANGIGFAIPADRAERVVEDLLRYGRLEPLWTGLRLITIDPELARQEGFPINRGAYVERVFEDSPAARAGLQVGDLIVTVMGRPVTAREDITTALASVPPGTPVPLGVRRGATSLEISLRAIRPPKGLGLRVFERSVGCRVTQDRNGNLVVESVVRGSPADRKGLRSGDVLLAANSQPLEDLETLGREVLRSLDRGGLLLVVRRGRFAYHLGFSL